MTSETLPTPLHQTTHGPAGTHMSSRLRAHILPLLSRTATALISSNMPGTQPGQAEHTYVGCTPARGRGAHSGVQVQLWQLGSQPGKQGPQGKGHGREASTRAPVSLSRPTMIIMPNSRPAWHGVRAKSSAAAMRAAGCLLARLRMVWPWLGSARVTEAVHLLPAHRAAQHQ